MFVEQNRATGSKVCLVVLNGRHLLELRIELLAVIGSLATDCTPVFGGTAGLTARSSRAGCPHGSTFKSANPYGVIGCRARRLALMTAIVITTGAPRGSSPAGKAGLPATMSAT